LAGAAPWTKLSRERFSRLPAPQLVSGGSRRQMYRIAHAYGNSSEKIAEAMAANVDYIETDIWFRDKAVWVRHERRLGPLPLLADRRRNLHYARRRRYLPFFSWYLLADIDGFRLENALEGAGPEMGLVLDTKGAYTLAESERFAGVLQEHMAGRASNQKPIVCGRNWALLDSAGRAGPPLRVFYTVGSERDWELFAGRIESAAVAGVCIDHRVLDAEKARVLREKKIVFICFTVDTAEEATRVGELGLFGITSNDLELLKSRPAS